MTSLQYLDYQKRSLFWGLYSNFERLCVRADRPHTWEDVPPAHNGYDSRTCGDAIQIRQRLLEKHVYHHVLKNGGIMKYTHTRSFVSIAMAALVLVSLCAVCASPLSVSAAPGRSTNVQAPRWSARPSPEHRQCALRIYTASPSLCAAATAPSTSDPRQIWARPGRRRSLSAGI